MLKTDCGLSGSVAAGPERGGHVMEVESGFDLKGSCKPSRPLRKVGGDNSVDPSSRLNGPAPVSSAGQPLRAFYRVLTRSEMASVNSLLFFCLWDGLQFG